MQHNKKAHRYNTEAIRVRKRLKNRTDIRKAILVAESAYASVKAIANRPGIHFRIL